MILQPNTPLQPNIQQYSIWAEAREKHQVLPNYTVNEKLAC